MMISSGDVKVSSSRITLSCYSGTGANASDGASGDQVTAANVAKECLLNALKMDSKAAHLWGNLSNAYYMSGDHKSSGKCLEKVQSKNLNFLFQITTYYLLPVILQFRSDFSEYNENVVFASLVLLSTVKAF